MNKYMVKLSRFFCVLFISALATHIHADGGDSSLIHVCVDAQNVIKLSGPNLTCPAGETPLHWSIQGPPGPLDPVLLGRIDTIEAQVALLQTQIAGLLSPTLPDVMITDVTIAEGTTTTQKMPFILSLSMPSADTVVADFFTLDGAADISDYNPRTGQVVFLPGETSKIIEVTLLADTETELDETFFVELGGIINANGTGTTGTGTLLNDDFPSVSISAVSGSNEGDLYLYDITLSAPVSIEASVNYSTSDGSATVGEDYTDTSGVAVFSPGQTLAQILVQTYTDSLAEGTEDFSVGISNPVGAILSTSQVVSTITDNNNVQASILDASVVEGNSGATPFGSTGFTIMQMNVSLSQSLTGTVSVRFGQSTGGTATTYSFFNQAGDIRVTPFSSCHVDINPNACPTLVFNAGETVKTLLIQINGDTVPENNENFFVKIFDPSGGLVINNAVAEGTIIDDD